MTRTFLHSFDPPSASPVNAATVDLDVADIEDAGIREVLQTPGAAYGAWSILDALLTPTGVGTPVEAGKQKLTIDGKDYLLELPIKADVALVKAYKADKAGNLVFRKAARNFNPLMATAADLVIVEAQNIVEIGEIDPDEVMTPGIFVNYLVQG